ncbi:putative pyridoxamine 5'-phosphate oxidase-related protein [Actinoplanes missouriensis 431]|uniref:Putative pyridoxamine 5'-phosphate oxidase-related protein n=1 Tax=Actinoplanes missouriensis (strain ATCC 14538 / DSM 43046 / CBS 188.64 / JCM 3121 / NBRC 102363 / NCIMB 12654 / NRRL B-3342 / UNCC 431) TaxID=512565 RepID=I0H690_ACTM4|nr:pyridoxamine 5'-phosphate oxidase family protein [Actinoplanes missouriensis]BAL88527.1 putative pyridoxamine 5'-phosphate oxidase-related protein [Actinoplanes missouriensis 431]
MIDGEIGERLALAQTAWFTSVRPDRSPHTVPVWFVHDEAGLWVASSPSSRKIANVRLNDQVSLAVDGSGGEPLVALAGADILDDVPDHPRVVANFARKYGGFDITTESYSGPLVLLRLTITRWLLEGSAQ